MRRERSVHYPFVKELSRFQRLDNFKTPFVPFGTVPNHVGLGAKLNIFYEINKFFNKKVRKSCVFDKFCVKNIKVLIQRTQVICGYKK